jgi:integrase
MSIRALMRSFEMAQRAEARSPYTVRLYQDCLRRFVRFVEAQTGSDAVSGLSRRLLTDYMAFRAASVAPATLWTDFKVLRVFCKWLVAEDELAVTPMERMRQPRQPVVPVPVFGEGELRALIAACSGSGMRERRDLSILRLMIDCGLRRGECASLHVEDVDLDAGTVRVTGKGKTRVVAYGPKTGVAIDRWMRRRRDAASLFGLTPSGLYQALCTRAAAAGVVGFHPHRLRHDFAHRWLVAGGNEGDLMEVVGWSSVSMLRRYGQSAASSRAQLASRKLALGERY